MNFLLHFWGRTHSIEAKSADEARKAAEHEAKTRHATVSYYEVREDGPHRLGCVDGGATKSEGPSPKIKIKPIKPEPEPEPTPETESELTEYVRPRFMAAPKRRPRKS